MGRVQGVGTLPSNTTGILLLKKTLWCIGVEVNHETRLKAVKMSVWHCSLLYCLI